MMDRGIDRPVTDCATLRRQTIRERMMENKRMFEENLASINQALDFMDKNPGYEEFHNLIVKTGY